MWEGIPSVPPDSRSQLDIRTWGESALVLPDLSFLPSSLNSHLEAPFRVCSRTVSMAHLELVHPQVVIPLQEFEISFFMRFVRLCLGTDLAGFSLLLVQ